MIRYKCKEGDNVKKIITYEITSEEIDFIKNAPIDPCKKCYDSMSGACGGCPLYSKYKEKIKGYDKEVVKLANTYNLYKDKLKEVEKLKKEAVEIKNSMPEQIFD